MIRVVLSGLRCAVVSCRDLMELRLNRWIPRREEEKAKTMVEVRINAFCSWKSFLEDIVT